MSEIDGKLWRCDVVTCGHVWYSPGEPPKRCSRCKSPYWNKVGQETIIARPIKTESPKVEEKAASPKLIVKDEPKSKPEPAISREKCLKPNHLVFKNGDTWVCMTCKKEK